MNLIIDFMATAIAVTILGILIIYVPAVMVLIGMRVREKWRVG